MRSQAVARAAKKRQSLCSRCACAEGLCGHHVVALADGGMDADDNVDILCDRCHRDWHRYEAVMTYEDFVSSIPGDILSVMSAKFPEADMGLLQEMWSALVVRRVATSLGFEIVGTTGITAIQVTSHRAN